MKQKRGSHTPNDRATFASAESGFVYVRSPHTVYLQKEDECSKSENPGIGFPDHKTNILFLHRFLAILYTFTAFL